MNMAELETFLKKQAQQFFEFIVKLFFALFTAPWLWLVGYVSVLSVFFWYSYYTVIQEKKLSFSNGIDPSKFVDSVLFTPSTPANPVSYPQYYWMVLGFVFLNLILSVLFQEQFTKKFFITLFWASWFVLLIFTIAAFPLFIGAIG